MRAWIVSGAVAWVLAGCGDRPCLEPCEDPGRPEPGSQAPSEQLPALPEEARNAAPCGQFDGNGAMRCTGFAGPFERSRRVLRDRAAWAAFWAEAHAGQRSGLPMPEIDFSQQMLILATGGMKPSSGYHLFFGAQTPASIEVVELEPGPGCITMAVVTFPWAVKRVPLDAQDPQFIERAGAYRCSE